MFLANPSEFSGSHCRGAAYATSFHETSAARLNQDCALEVVERKGTTAFTLAGIDLPGNFHLELVRVGSFRYYERHQGPRNIPAAPPWMCCFAAANLFGPACLASCLGNGQSWSARRPKGVPVRGTVMPRTKHRGCLGNGPRGRRSGLAARTLPGRDRNELSPTCIDWVVGPKACFFFFFFELSRGPLRLHL